MDAITLTEASHHILMENFYIFIMFFYVAFTILGQIWTLDQVVVRKNMQWRGKKDDGNGLNVA